MLVRLSPRQRFDILVGQFEPAIRKAFEDAIAEIRSQITLKRVVERMERGDINGAIAAMNLDEAAFRPLDEAIRQTFTGGGVAAVEQMPALRNPDGHQFVIRFDVRNIEAETWLQQHSAQLVTNIVADQVEAVRTALSAGLSRGDNPTRTALDVIGRVSRVTGARSGGILGLTAQQARYVATVRDDLLSGDPERLRHYLTLGPRDKRFDKTVATAIKAEKPFPQDMVARITGRYSDGLLKLRGDTIARTETLASLSQANVAAYQQAIAKGAVRAETITKTWHTAGDNRVRDTHRGMSGQKVGFNDKFRSPSGAMLAYPCDPSAPASETINCRCWMQIKIDHLAGLR